jgi:hypothetical protein
MIEWRMGSDSGDRVRRTEAVVAVPSQSPQAMTPDAVSRDSDNQILVKCILCCDRRPNCVRVVGRGVTKTQESEPPSALSLSASRDTACARPAKRRRRRGEVRSPACAPERW